MNSAAWTKYKKVIRKAHDYFNQSDITWMKHVPKVARYNEQPTQEFTPVMLKGLVNFNSFRTWPITKTDDSGQLDNQNMVLFLNREYLGELNLLTPLGYFNFRPDIDYFIHQGIKYKSEGDTGVSQADKDPLHIILILHREEIHSGESLYAAVAELSASIQPTTPSFQLTFLNPTYA